VGTAKRDRQRANRQQRLEELARDARKTKTKRWGLWIGLGVPVLVALLFLLAKITSDGSGSTPSATTPSTATTLPTTSIDPNASTTSVDPNASTTVDPNASTTTDPNATTTTLAPFAYGKGGCPAADGSSVRQSTFSQAFKLCIDPTKTYSAKFDTSAGEIDVDLNTSDVPGTVNNFVTLARFHYYDKTSIFRTDPSLDVIQGGGKTNSDTPGYSIPDEKAGFSYSEGDLVMARSDTANSGGGQWFFVAGPNASVLDAQGTYVTFGKVTTGLDVVKSILALAGEDGQTPVSPVTVNSITITES
jgi:peptidyl-prolyl cis-trans isomerase B (cyclophilin B)